MYIHLADAVEPLFYIFIHPPPPSFCLYLLCFFLAFHMTEENGREGRGNER